jgi:hypothetical protein
MKAVSELLSRAKAAILGVTWDELIVAGELRSDLAA